MKIKGNVYGSLQHAHEQQKSQISYEISFQQSRLLITYERDIWSNTMRNIFQFSMNTVGYQFYLNFYTSIIEKYQERLTGRASNIKRWGEMA
jgi:hypothetical protein